uniref:triple tyrosine motif-containing protein n=1 Tax=Mariniflexile sp. TaxID=1979402 RepID=UPI0040482928
MSFFLIAQERPTIEIFRPIDYGAETQNWSISQSKNKFIYVANNKGLLEFNGAEWQLYNSPNETIIRSVNVIDELIYTGCYREFGFWKRNEFGLLVYTSLSKKLKIKFLDDEEFWNIIRIDNYILFQSLNRIYVYNQDSKSYTFIESKTGISKMFEVNKTIYYQKNRDGIYKIENGASKLVSDNQILKNNLLVNIFDFHGKLLMETEDSGFFVLENNTLAKWNVPANQVLLKENVYRSIQLKDKNFILGTRSNGVLNVTQEGVIDYKINTINGLSNNTIHFIYEDVEHNIWLALNNGINCINVDSPFNIFNDAKGKIGSVNASAVFNNNLYLGSNQGLFVKPLNEETAFKFIEGTQGAVWSLNDIDNQLFCGHDSGTFVVNNGAVTKIADIQGTWNVLPINNNLLLQGNYDGLYVLEKLNGTWRLKNKIEGFNLSSRFFEIANNNKILVSHEYRGVYKIKVDKELTKTLEIIKDATIENELNTSIIKYNDQILFTCNQGVYKYNEAKNLFFKDSILSKLILKDDYTSGRLLFNKSTNTLFSFSKKNLNYMKPEKLTGAPIVNRISFSKTLPRGQTGYENITNIKDNKYLIGTSSGYVIVDLDKIEKKVYTVNISSISINDLKSTTHVNKDVEGAFKNQENNIEFRYNVAEFDKYFDTEYQYQLETMYPEWSNWDPSPVISFKNLQYGNYTLNVRAKVGNTLTKNVASYKFSIERPWHLSNLMILFYGLLLLFFSLFMHHVYKRHYRKQREKLLERTMHELELKELENKQQLMRFNNDKLRQDIDNKNRELGISTMSLIKKNEFLNNIKKELNKVEDPKQLKHVIKIIDRNINNSDDWHLFEEAFNNADKDFLKKIKHEHPSLTHNDLRLCAYLRLNLSSKEIAPLLNISARSVEVKRYRLRKKMDLPHESSLTDYILEI